MRGFLLIKKFYICLQKTYIFINVYSILRVYLKYFKRICGAILLVACALFALDAFVLPEVTPELKSNASEYFQNECKGCHRWARKFAAPPMHDNVAHYADNPKGMVEYLMHPTPKHPEEWPAMDITPLSEVQAKMMTAWLLYILENPEDPGRPK